MKSASKKTRKRVHSPDKDILPTPKKIRSKHPTNTPVVDDIISSRPVTRSSNTPLLSNKQTTRHGSSKKSSTTDRTHISDVARSVGSEDEVESRGDSTATCTGTTVEAVKSSTISVDRSEFVTASTPRCKTSSRATRPGSIGKLNTDTFPPNRRYSRAPASVAHHSIDDMHSRSEYVAVRPNLDTMNTSEPHNRAPSNTLEPLGSSLDVYIRLSRILVILTILLFAFASLVRLDHDKHDTHGSVSRSGRKMYRLKLTNAFMCVNLFITLSSCNAVF